MKYRKKPVEIEAMRFTEAEKDRVYSWARGIQMSVHPAWGQNNEPLLRIPTLEGEMTASIGDWIIKGVKGELYPCKSDIFDMTYEPANPTQP